MIRNKILAAVITAAFMAVAIGGCGLNQGSHATAGSDISAPQDENSPETDSPVISIVTTIFPEYDWVREITKDSPAKIETTLLMDDGVDLHSFQPTAEDIMTISDCDVFIYVGGESDAWVEDALKEAVNKDMTVLSLLDILGDAAREEVIVEGMEDPDDGDEEVVEYDEHVWLSLRNAAILTEAIEKAVEDKDPANESIYTSNLSAYIGELHSLDEEYATTVAGGGTKTLVFGDRFPFLYMASDYGLEYYAAFAGCSAETEASFETIIFLTDKVNELGLHAVCTIESSDQEIAKTIRSNTKTKDQEILIFDSLQSTSSKDIKGGATYLKLMEKNLEVLKEALA